MTGIGRGVAGLLIVSVGVLTGCATTSSRTGYRDVDTMVRERVGVHPQLEAPMTAGRAPSGTATAGAVASGAQVTRRMLDGTLRAERAVELALLNNATLRGRAAEFGVAHADLVQASLITNPKVHASFRFPAGGGAEGTGSEAGIDLDFLDVLTRPLKTRMAAKQFEQAKLRLSHEILKLAVEVKTAFFAYQATLERLSLRRAVVDSLKTSVELSERQLEAGNVSALELANHRAAYQDALVELRNDEAEADVDREKLALLMGVQDQGPITVTPQLPAVPALEPDLKRLEALALAQRWDLSAARREPAVLEDALKISRMNVLSGIEVGVDSERDFDGSRGIGPDAVVPLPVFDRRQAANARAKAHVKQSRYAITALEQEVRFDVRSAWLHLAATRKNAETYRTSLLPLRRELVEETLKRYNFMLEGVYQLLQAKQNELGAQRSYIEAEKSYWTKWAELERAVGGRIPADLVPPEQRPAPQQAAGTAVMPEAPAHHHGGHK